MLGSLLLALIGSPQDAGPPQLLDVRLSPAAELWNEVRWLAGGDEPAEDHPLAAAVAAARACAPLISSPLAWGGLDAVGSTAEPGFWLARVDDLKLPNWILAEGAKRRVLRTHLEELLAALDTVAPTWLETEWPLREQALQARRAALLERLDPASQTAMLHRIDRWLGLHALAEPARIVLTTHAAPPGGLTVFADGQPLCLVAVEDRSVLLLAEVAVHEALHALHSRPTPGPTNLFTLTQVGLQRARVRNEDRQRDYVHTVYFVAAAELVRSVLDPEHVDYGVSEGYYAKVESAYATLAPLWRQLVAQDISKTDFASAVGLAAAAEEQGDGPGD